MTVLTAADSLGRYHLRMNQISGLRCGLGNGASALLGSLEKSYGGRVGLSATFALGGLVAGANASELSWMVASLVRALRSACTGTALRPAPDEETRAAALAL